MRLLLVRHGETDDNANKIFQGRHGRGLSEKGRFQAGRLAERLRHAKIARIVSSDLERAVETASHVGRAHAIDVHVDPELREVDVGAWTGLSYAEVEARFPDEWQAWKNGVDVRRGGGETYAELGERIHAAIDRIAAQSPSIASATAGDVVIVSHGAALRTYIAKILGLAVSTPTLGSIANTSITTVEHDGKRARLLGWNDVAHLDPR